MAAADARQARDSYNQGWERVFVTAYPDTYETESNFRGSEANHGRLSAGDRNVFCPHLGSLILTHAWHGEVRDLKEVGRNDRPSVPMYFLRSERCSPRVT